MRAFVVALAILFIPAIAFAVVDPSQDPSGWLGAMLDSFKSSNWKLVTALGIMAVVAFLRGYGPKLFQSGKAAVYLSLVVGGLASIAAGLGGGVIGSPLDVIKASFDGVMTALVASGLYSATKKLDEEKPSDPE